MQFWRHLTSGQCGPSPRAANQTLSPGIYPGIVPWLSRTFPMNSPSSPFESSTPFTDSSEATPEWQQRPPPTEEESCPPDPAPQALPPLPPHNHHPPERRLLRRCSRWRGPERSARGKAPGRAVACGSLSTSSLLTPSAVKPTSDRKIPPQREPDARRRKGVRVEPSVSPSTGPKHSHLLFLTKGW